jgi:hypothetical protein
LTAADVRLTVRPLDTERWDGNDNS